MRGGVWKGTCLRVFTDPADLRLDAEVADVDDTDDVVDDVDVELRLLRGLRALLLLLLLYRPLVPSRLSLSLPLRLLSLPP